MLAYLYSLSPDDPLLGEQEEEALSECDSDESECEFEPEDTHASAVQHFTDSGQYPSDDLQWEEDEDPDEDPDSLATQLVMNVLEELPLYRPEDIHEFNLQGLTSEEDIFHLLGTEAPPEDQWEEGEIDPDEAVPINPIVADLSDDLKEGGDDLDPGTDTWCEVEYHAEEFGRVYTKGIPRFDIAKLRPFEVMFCDNKDYDTEQRGGHTTALVFVCLKTLAKQKVDLVRKIHNGRAAQAYYVMNGVHKLPYKCTMYSDGCGSMAHVAAASIRLGIDHVNIPPHDHSLNLAEYAQKQMWDVGRTLLHAARANDNLMALAVSYAMYVDMRMSPSSETRSNKTPYEQIIGTPPDVSHLVPFFSKSYVTVPRPKRAMLKKRGLGTLRAEPGRFVGFSHPYGNTSRILLDEQTTTTGHMRGNRMVDSISVTHYPQDHVMPRAQRDKSSTGEESHLSIPAPQIRGGALKHRVGDAQDAHLHGSYSQEANEIYNGQSPGPDYDPSSPEELDPTQLKYGCGHGPGPFVRGSNKRHACEHDCGYESDDIDKVIAHEQSRSCRQDGRDYVCDCGADFKTQTALSAHLDSSDCPLRERHEEPCPQQPGLTFGDMDDVTVDIEEGLNTPAPSPEESARVCYISEVKTAMRICESSEEPTLGQQSRMDCAIYSATTKFMETSGANKVDQGALREVSSLLAQGALKDIQWKVALESDLKEGAIKAYEKEMASLEKTILRKIDPATYANMEKARKEATSCRVLLDVKRNGTVKARAVKQGFKEDKVTADGPNFNYYSHVAKMDTIRALILRPNRRNRILAVKDVSTAFLQSHRFKGFIKYVTIKNPVTGEWHYYEQFGPIYGEASAPVRWENTLIPWLEQQGFIRGDNEKSVLYHPGRDLTLVVYVDDILADGFAPDVDWIFDLLDKRFDCKEADYLTPNTPLDYVGIEVEMTDDRIYIHMNKYIQVCLAALDLLDSKKGILSHKTPITLAIETAEAPLNPGDTRYFLTGLGMLGWLANTTRPDVAFAHSRIGQHAASPTQEAKRAIQNAFLYLAKNPELSLSIPLYDNTTVRQIYNGHPKPQERWKFFVDADYAGNHEVQNKRRSQNANVITVEGTPIHWCSKVSSVAFAHPSIGEAHADMSSGASEVYAAGNAAQDLLHFSYCIDEMGLTKCTDFPKPMTLQMDNTTAEVFTNDTAFKSRLKHIDVRQEWVKCLRNKSIIIPVHVPTEDNLADLFTKILHEPTFVKLRDQMMTPLPPASSSAA